MRRQWFIVLAVEIVIMAVVGLLLALVSAGRLPSSLITGLVVGGMIAAAFPFILVGVILPGRVARRIKYVQQNGLPGMAEPLVDAEPLAAAKLKGISEYSGPEIFLDVPGRVWPTDGSLPYETTMQAGFFFAHFLRPGVKVAVKIDPQDKNRVVLNDTIPDIVQRNPQLRRDS